jgi:hypothetical protein
MSNQRDWDKELAAIDRAIEKTPAGPAPVPAAAGQRAPAAREQPAAQAGRGAVFATWLLVLLTLALAAALPFWPYPARCGTGLFLHLGANGMLVLAGIWAAGATWRRRMGLAHTLALLAILWGLGLIADQVLMRIGYARAAAAWLCG